MPNQPNIASLLIPYSLRSSRHRIPSRAAANRTRILAVLLLVGLLAGVLWKAASSRAQTPNPNPAVNTPDKFAWDLFIQINHPADKSAGRGVPDTKKKIGDPGEVVWETWKLARTEVFLPGGEKPGPWDAVAPLALSPRQRFEPSKAKVLRAIALGLPEPGEGGVGALLDPDPNELNNESRMNRPTFEFVVNNELYNVEGQEAFLAVFGGFGKKIDFPVDSMEIKGSWKVLGADGKVPEPTLKRYHTAKSGGFVYGLVGLHIITKDIPNWFWATFEHIDNPRPEIGDVDRSGYPARDPTVKPEDPDFSIRRAPLPPVLKGTKWENYRLRGTQVDFVDSRGNPTILGNTTIEGGFQASSSCISCHANATIGEKLNLPNGTFVPPAGQIRLGANRLTVFFSFTLLPINPLNPDPNNDPVILIGPIDRPDPGLFTKGGMGRARYAQLDFLWSLRRAQRKTTP
jgi:hypothetical protein